MKTEVITFRQIVYPDSIMLFKERCKDNGNVSSVSIRFYSGSEGDLHIKPYILHKGNKAEDLFTFAAGTNGFISGDDDYFVFPCDLSFQYDDEICVWVHNTNVDWDYTCSVDFVINYGGYDGMGDE